MTESVVRESVEINLGGKSYEFPRPVIAKRREFQKDALRVAELWEQMDFPLGVEPLSVGATPVPSAKNMRLTIELSERILKYLVEYCSAIRIDQQALRDKFNAGEITESDLGREWGKLKDFVSAPFVKPKEGVAPVDTNASG